MHKLQALIFINLLLVISPAKAQELKNITPYEDSIKNIIARLPEFKWMDSNARSTFKNEPAAKAIVQLMERPSLHQPLYYVIEIATYPHPNYNDYLFRKTFYYNPAERKILVQIMGGKPISLAKYRKREARGLSFGDHILSVFGTRCK